jgi:hypothetical protein
MITLTRFKLKGETDLKYIRKPANEVQNTSPAKKRHVQPFAVNGKTSPISQ